MNHQALKQKNFKMFNYGDDTAHTKKIKMLENDVHNIFTTLPKPMANPDLFLPNTKIIKKKPSALGLLAINIVN